MRKVYTIYLLLIISTSLTFSAFNFTLFKNTINNYNISQQIDNYWFWKNAQAVTNKYDLTKETKVLKKMLRIEFMTGIIVTRDFKSKLSVASAIFLPILILLFLVNVYKNKWFFILPFVFLLLPAIILSKINREQQQKVLSFIKKEEVEKTKINYKKLIQDFNPNKLRTNF